MKNLFFMILMITFSFGSKVSAYTTITSTIEVSNENSNLINDSLVTNLLCDQLTEENVLTFVNRAEAFKLTRQIPINNYNEGINNSCWAFSLAQRPMFY